MNRILNISWFSSGSPHAGCLTGPVAPGAQHDRSSSDGRNDYRGQPSHQLESRQGQEREEPEPQDKIDLKTKLDIKLQLFTDLLIDDVEGEDTQTVELLLPGGGAHWLEGAAGDGREDGAERVGLLQSGDFVVTEVDHHLGSVSAEKGWTIDSDISSVYTLEIGLQERNLSDKYCQPQPGDLGTHRIETTKKLCYIEFVY